MRDLIEEFKNEVICYTEKISDEEWVNFRAGLKPVCFKRGDTIFQSNKVCKEVFFIVDGIAASEFHKENECVVTRFFRSKNLCSNVMSYFTSEVVNDRIFAITNIKGVMIPKDLFNNSYLYSRGIGLYFRKILLENSLEAKMLISVKTMSGVESKLKFLQESYPEIILEAPWKYIANFIGITPEWLSRTLNKKKHQLQKTI
ncbi:MAG: hypothetical protein AAF149_20145 [Bacteroidota bacterium]